MRDPGVLFRVLEPNSRIIPLVTQQVAFLIDQSITRFQVLAPQLVKLYLGEVVKLSPKQIVWVVLPNSAEKFLAVDLIDFDVDQKISILALIPITGKLVGRKIVERMPFDLLPPGMT